MLNCFSRSFHFTKPFMMKVKIKATDKAKHMKAGEIYSTSKAVAETLIARGWAVDPDSVVAEPEKPKRRKSRK